MKVALSKYRIRKCNKKERENDVENNCKNKLEI